MRAAALTALIAVLLLVTGHVLVVFRDALFQRWLEKKTTSDGVGGDMVSVQHLLVGAAAFVAAYLVCVSLNGEARMSYVAVVLLGVLMGWGSWVAARIAYRRKTIADRPVPLWSAAPLAVVLAVIFAWSGIA